MLNRRHQLLWRADIDYLSARLLTINGILYTAASLSAEAFEKILKLFLVLHAKIEEDRELTSADLKKEYGHDLIKLFRALKAKLPDVRFEKEWDDYMEYLKKSYSYRYPDNYARVMQFETSLRQLDHYYSHLRKGVVMNFPQEEIIEAKKFGGASIGILMQPPLEELIKAYGGKGIRELLSMQNECFAEFELPQIIS